jgi:Uma2 family endonuclease
MTALLKTRPDMSTPPTRERSDRIVLHDIPWQSYKTIRHALPDRHIFLTYDQGTLEIMVLSAEHEQYKSKLSLLVHILARHCRKNLSGFGSFTQQREGLLKGIESDDCFYIDSLPAVLGKKNIDLERDPPPDLALEVDVKHSSLDRLEICAALKISEVWLFDGKTLTVLVLREGKYEPVEFSPTFPGIPMDELARFILLGVEKGELVMWEEFEKWLREHPIKKKRKKS